MAKTTRRESRETAFELLFEWSFKDESLDEILETAKLARNLEPDKFTRLLAERVIENRAGLDALIERYSQGWKLSRISRTALTILRMSFCEMTRFDDIPAGATINEAVELAKKFGSDEEAAYLNGILGSFERARREGREPVPEEHEAVSEDCENAEQIPPAEDSGREEAREQDNSAGFSYGEPELVNDIIIEIE